MLMQVSKWKTSVSALLVGVAVLAGAGPARAADALNFTDPLTGPTSPYLTIDFSKYGYTTAGLLRIQSDSGTGNGTDRPMVKTVSAGFLGRNFDYQVEVLSSPGNQDIIYVGFGEGVPNVNFFNEPTNSALFRIHQNIAGNRVDVAVDSGFSSWPFAVLETVGTYAASGTVFRISRHDDVLAMEIVGQPLSLRTLSVSSDLGFLNLTNGYLFFGNTAEGTTFRDVSVVSLPMIIDSDGDGVLDSADQGPGTAAGARVDANGCSGAQVVAQACPLTASWRNHGAYVSCVARASNEALANGLLTDAERSAIQSAAARSSIGK